MVPPLASVARRLQRDNRAERQRHDETALRTALRRQIATAHPNLPDETRNALVNRVWAASMRPHPSVPVAPPPGPTAAEINKLARKAIKAGGRHRR